MLPVLLWQAKRNNPVVGAHKALGEVQFLKALQNGCRLSRLPWACDDLDEATWLTQPLHEP
jgi:hypothetical protein